MIAHAQAVPPREEQPAAPHFLDSLNGRIEPVPLSFSYRVALAVVAFAMILLPFVYVALIAGVGWGVVWYALHGLDLLTEMRPKAKAIAYVTPLVAGATVIFFLLKPLLLRQKDDGGEVSVDPEDEPLLFEFVRRVALSVGAPVPREIRLDSDVNASAGLRRGLLSLFSDDLVLTLGVPMVAGTTLGQLTGVIAHEFGHFGQRGGMRLRYVIGSVNLWFARVAYERDRFDEKLEDSFKRGRNGHVRVITAIAAACVWVSRTLLKGLMIAGHVISSSLARQMEFDADRHAVRLVGHEVYARTHRSIFELSRSYRQSLNNVPKSYELQILPESLAVTTQMILGRHKQLLESEFQKHLAQGRTSLFSTHPTTRERIAKSMREPAEALFASDLPASVLFRDFAGMERAFSHVLYELILEQPVPATDLISAEEALIVEEGFENRRAAERYIPSGASILNPLPLPAALPVPPTDPRQALKQAIAAAEAHRSAMTAGVDEYGDLFQAGTKAYRAEGLLRIGVSINHVTYGLDRPEIEHARDIQRSIAERLDGITRQLAPAKEATAHRLALALSLAGQHEVVALYPEAATWQREEIPRLLDAVARIGTVLPQTVRVQEMHNLLDGLLRFDIEGLHKRGIEQLTRRGHELLSEIWNTLETTRDPLAAEPVSLARTCLPAGLPPMEPQPVVVAIRGYLGNEFDLYERLLGRMCHIAEAVESAYS